MDAIVAKKFSAGHHGKSLQFVVSSCNTLMLPQWLGIVPGIPSDAGMCEQSWQSCSQA